METSKPLKTTVPMLMRLADPVPLASSKGRNPANEVIAVKTIGRMRSSAASVMASRRGTPAQPVEISSSIDSKTYRYNLQGEAIKESYLSDVEAVQAGYISLSILDYNLTKEDENNDLIKALCQ